MGPTDPDWHHQAGAGGMEIPGPWGVSVAANITLTNLADRSDAAIKQAITADGTRLLPPMGFGYYKNISASDLDALVAYLRSLPAR